MNAQKPHAQKPQAKQQPRKRGLSRSQRVATNRARRAARPRRQTRAPRARLGAPAWVRSLRDPCSVRDVRIPDGQMFPTATGSIRIMKSFTAPSATAKTVIGFSPQDFMLTATGGTHVYSLFHYASSAVSDSTSFGQLDSASNNWAHSAAVQATAPYSTLAPLMKSARVVSACAKLSYTGSALVNGGLVTGFVLSQDQIAGSASAWHDPQTNVAQLTQHSTPASIRNLPFNVAGPLRDGMEVFKYPTSRDELHFADRDSPNMVGDCIVTFAAEHGTMGFLIDWSDTSQTVMIEYVVNFEYNPYSFATASTRTVPFEPSTISKIGALASSIYNLVRPLTPHVVPLIRHAAQRYVQAGNRASSVTIEEV